jgi:hypothetical protein
MRASKVRTRAVCALSLMVPHRQEKGDADHMGRAGVRDPGLRIRGPRWRQERIGFRPATRSPESIARRRPVWVEPACRAEGAGA